MWEFELDSNNERRAARVRQSYSFREVEPTKKYMGDDLFQQRFSLSLTIGTEFWSNSAQLEHKKEDARMVLYSHLFKDMVPLVNEIICDTSDDLVRRNAMALKDMMVPK